MEEKSINNRKKCSFRWKWVGRYEGLTDSQERLMRRVKEKHFQTWTLLVSSAIYERTLLWIPPVIGITSLLILPVCSYEVIFLLLLLHVCLLSSWMALFRSFTQFYMWLFTLVLVVEASKNQQVCWWHLCICVRFCMYAFNNFQIAL